MDHFITNKISLNSENIAEQLKNIRLSKKITLQKVSQKLNINYTYLKALEDGDLKKLPSGIYGRNFLKKYADFLEVNYEELLELFNYENSVFTEKEQENLFVKKITNPHYLLSVPRLIKNGIIIIIVVIFISYLGYYIKNIISAPKLHIIYPDKDLKTSATSINIIGTTEKEATVIINGENILIDKIGRFEKKINLKNDLNTIKIISQKKYSKQNVIERKIFFQN